MVLSFFLGLTLLRILSNSFKDILNVVSVVAPLIRIHMIKLGLYVGITLAESKMLKFFVQARSFFFREFGFVFINGLL